jgi:hypothetical protein
VCPTGSQGNERRRAGHARRRRHQINPGKSKLPGAVISPAVRRTVNGQAAEVLGPGRESLESTSQDLDRIRV